jgi:hypothetical protein
MKKRPECLHTSLCNPQCLGGFLGSFANGLLPLRLNRKLGSPRASRPPDKAFLLLRLVDRGSSGSRRGGSRGSSDGCRGGGSNDGLLSLGNRRGMVAGLVLAEVGLLEHGSACSAHAGGGLVVGERRHIYWGRGRGNWCSGGIGWLGVGGRGRSRSLS